MMLVIEEILLTLAYIFGFGVLTAAAVVVFFIGLIIILAPAYWVFKHFSEKPFKDWEIWNG